MNPKVSIIMGVYNGGEFLRESVRSVLGQTFKDFELIIVNDASSDGSAEIIKELQNTDDRIKLLNNSTNLGLTKTLNIGIQASRGEYLARLDSGDLCSTDRLEKQVRFLEANRGVGLLGSFMHIINTHGEIIKEVTYPTEDQEIKRDLIKYNPFVHSSIMFRKSVGEKAGFYDEDFRYAQDYFFYFKLFPFTKFANLPLYLVKYRHMPNSITSTKNKKQMYFANKARAWAIGQGFYGKINYVYVLKYFLISLIPTKVKFFIKRFI